MELHGTAVNDPAHFRSRIARAQLRSWIATVIVILAIATGTRLVLIFANLDQIRDELGGAILMLGMGILCDLGVALWLIIPGILFPVLLPRRLLLSRIWAWVVRVWWFAFVFGLLFLGVAEFFFFDEFSSRFNTVAVDYLIFPNEVFVNIWDTYPVLYVLIVDFAITVAIASLLYVRWRRVPSSPLTRKARLALTGAVLIPALLVTWLVNPRASSFSDNRVLQQIAQNGLYSFADAAMTNELEYDAHYATVDIHRAFATVRDRIAEPHSRFLLPAESLSIDRAITYDSPQRNLNIVIVLEESFGAKFIHLLDSGAPVLTPEFEKLCDKGLLFTNVYATGNRTVRGMEGVLLGFPPIPGQSIVRRPGGENVFSLPSLLKSFGYQTAFVYGGYSYFDNMKAFTEHNGFERVYDRTDFPNKTFTTIWGVCDEDLFDSALMIFDSLHHVGRPFFSLVLTVSNHSPYTYPEGRIAADPKEQERENVVQYMDFALGRFMRDAERHPFFDSTLFVVLGDHGARVYGSQKIPFRSYHIPVLFYAPAIIDHGQQNRILGSQIDIAPTIMGILSRNYVSQFFGRDLLKMTPDEGAALMSHNRDVALIRGDVMGVLGIQSDTMTLVRDSTGQNFVRQKNIDDSTIVNVAVAYFQTAYYLYENHLLHPLDQERLLNKVQMTR